MDDPPQLNLSFESTSLSLPLSLPDTPTSPITPLDPKPKKSNPLNDLIDTEKAYSDLLGGVIKKVAAAWSRSNMPPPKLDTMFRSIESVYRSNRSLLSKLKEIGTSSPKALGDLLIRWVDDLEGPYTNYCTQYRFGFDEWEPVKSNARLAPILATFSAANPPPSSDTSLWTLDDLFLLPKGRLKYYKKLYTRLLKSTQAGRSDHRLLVDALEKLEKLLKILDERENVQVVTPIMPERPLSPVKKDEEDESEDNDNDNDNDMDEAVVNAGVSKDELDPTVVRDSDVAPTSTSEASSFRGSEGSGFERLSQDPPSSSTSRGSSSTMTTPVTDLERRLLTQRTLDIFTMNPKMVRLQMAPPGLTFTRECKCSMDVDIRLVPRATGVEMVHQRGHIFLLSDLFLMCERMTSQERAEHGANGADMWLMYPPLSGKVLRLSEVPGQENSLQVHIMRKETITLTVETLHDRNTLYHELKECIEFAASVGPISKQPPPPVPPLPGLSQSMSAPFPPSTSPGRDSDSSNTTPGTRTSSPPSLNESQGFNGVSTSDRGPSPRSSSGMDSITSQFSGMAMGPQRMSPSGPFPPMTSPPPSVGPGQVLRNRSLSQGPGSPPPSMGPGQIFGNPSLPRGPGSPAPSVGPGQIFRNPSMSHGPGSPPPSIGPGQIFRNPSMSHGPGSPPPSVGPGQVMERTRTISLGHGSNQAPPSSMSRPPSGPHPPHQPPMHQPNHPHSQQMFAPQPMHRPYGPNGEGPLPPVPPRPPSEPNYNVIRKSPSTRSLNAPRVQEPSRSAPPMPHLPPNGFAPHYNQGPSHPGPSHPGPSHPFTPPRPGPGMRNMSPGPSPNLRPTLPSSQFRRAVSGAQSFADPSPPSSPVEETPRFSGPTTLTISADMKCKVFLKQQHAQWKSLGTARLKLYRQSPTNVKQLVVEADSKDRQVLISTIVLTDGVERVGKTGVAVELSDKGARTGIVYMLQLRNDEAAGGFFDSLLEGSDRSGLR